MQFQYSNVLWGLLFLIIPIIVHLFQLRKFKKTAFTNVGFLQKLVAKSQKSSIIKKWLLLLTRLAVVTAIILAFAQPFTAKKTALQPKETVIYLDNSFSMEAPSKNGDLLHNAIQELIKSNPKLENFTLFTNNNTYTNNNLKEIQPTLLNTTHTYESYSYKEVLLKGKGLFSTNTNTLKTLLIISDFQGKMKITETDSLFNNLQLHLIPQQSTNSYNASIDSVFINEKSALEATIAINIKSNEPKKDLDVSIYNETQLLAKKLTNINDSGQQTVFINLPLKNAIKGKIIIKDNGLGYDNTFYFKLGGKSNIKILIIEEGNSSFLNKIYNQENFSVDNSTVSQLNYGGLENYNFIVLNNLSSIPESLLKNIIPLKKAGINFCIIPNSNADITSYNALTNLVGFGNMLTKKEQELTVTDINFGHPLYKDVFEKQIQNFQYPKVNSYFQSNFNTNAVLSFAGEKPFLLAHQGVYFFTAALTKENSNFTSAPLIVPTFYNMAIQSLQLPALYNNINQGEKIDIPGKFLQDQILEISNTAYSFIPQQQVLGNKIRIQLGEHPKLDGNYDVITNNNYINNLAFNYQRSEYSEGFTEISNSPNSIVHTQFQDFFNSIMEDNRINPLWKWFVILTLLFIVVEVFIQKFIK